jgi:RNA polymerase sigma-70 factor (ECF subfamily)
VPLSTDTEQTLVSRAQNGEAEAVAQLYDAHAPLVFRYVYYRVRDRQTAEDLTADVFLRMVETLPRYEQRGRPFAAWLFRIAHDRVVDFYRRNLLRRSAPLTDALADGEADTEAKAFQASTSQAMLAGMQALTDEQQTVIQLRFIEGYNLEQTGAIMSKSPGAIKGLQHRALRRLARQIERLS